MSLPVLTENFREQDLSFSLPIPDNTDHLAYLGLDDSRTITLDQIKTDVLEISVRTVETHRQNLMTKLDIRKIALLTKFALQQAIAFLD